MQKMTKTAARYIFVRNFWRMLRDYVGGGKGSAKINLDTPATLGTFLHSRASHVAQTSLYGYMKTRAGTRFPQLFSDAAMLASINIAKWQLWLACLTDLTVYCGVLLRSHSEAPTRQIHALLQQLFAQAVADVAPSTETGDDFAASVNNAKLRIANTDLDKLQDDDSAFTASPQALVCWAPVADELKNRDAEIMRNSVRFRWQEIRRHLRKQLRAEAVLKAVYHADHCSGR